MQAIPDRIEELETKLSFQEATLEELSQEIFELNKVVAEQQFQIQLLISKLKAVEPSNVASQSEETPPPHY
ncbi:SlyX family protein [Shewanella chilikensis]|uniref:SlyX family protein n=1 Tax=Shewanella chilikensis TaxID=558541 RepID=UPI001F3BA58B|nr:SlyX family protein [Shewanella chilikensis]MCE9788514.1 SlyX family protein [Shewanella chilikensis]